MAVISFFSSSGVHAGSEKTNVIKCLRSGPIGRALDCYRNSTVGICTNGLDRCHDGAFSTDSPEMPLGEAQASF